jgi:hypothetical protein
MFSEKYPNLAILIENQSQIQLGDSSEYYPVMIRIISEYGLEYEDENSSSLDEALEKAEIWASEENED